MGEQHWIFWDGECGFCRRSVAWSLSRDRHNEFRAAPYQCAPSPPMTPELAEACERAVHVVTREGRILRAGRAVLFILERVAWGWFARLLALPPFVWIVEIVYRIVADHRPFFARFLFTREPDEHIHRRTGAQSC